jgi:hypothetical protein
VLVMLAEVMGSWFEGNIAANGGGIFNAGLGLTLRPYPTATLPCDPGHGDCFQLVLYNNTLDKNAAVGGGGGALYWLHMDTTAVVCTWVMRLCALCLACPTPTSTTSCAPDSQQALYPDPAHPP